MFILIITRAHCSHGCRAFRLAASFLFDVFAIQCQILFHAPERFCNGAGFLQPYSCVVQVLPANIFGFTYFGSCPPSVCINLLHLRFADRVKPHFVVYIILCLRVGIGLGFKTPFITTFVSSVFKFGLPNLIFMVECFL